MNLWTIIGTDVSGFDMNYILYMLPDAAGTRRTLNMPRPEV